MGRQVEDKLDGWKEDRIPLLPLGTAEITLSYSGTLIGITLFIGCCLQIFGFAAGAALLVALLLSLLTGGALFAQLEGLMREPKEKETIKKIVRMLSKKKKTK